MPPHKKLTPKLVLVMFCVLGFMFAQRLDAEAPSNPFGSVDQPAQPSDKGDFDDDDSDFVNPGANFGFTPPQPPPQAGIPEMNPAPAFNTNNSAPKNELPPPQVNSAVPKSTPPAARRSAPQPTTRSAKINPKSSPKTATSSTTMKAAPKLADYLELDSAVKGLEVKNFDLPDKDIKDVVTLISKWTGKNFIIDAKVRGKITIIGPAQVTLQEAYQAFLSALEANGLTTVQSGKFIRIIESAEARRAPVKTYAGDYAPKDDQFITRIFQLKYINSDEVQREFRDLTTRQGKLFAYEPTNSIIITDTGSNIQRIKEILETLDVKSFETTLHVLKMRGGSAKTIADMLANIYGDSKGGGANASRSFRRSALERTRGGGIISKIIPDEQTNSLVVLANQAGFEQLKQLVGKLDIKNLDTGRIHVYYCEYAKAEDLAATLASLSGSGGGGARKKSSSPSSGAASPGATSPIGGASGASSGPVSAELGDGVKITSDAATNSLVITANSADYQVIRRVIRKLDIPRLQVFVETAILEVAVDDGDTWGVNAAAGIPGRGFGGGFIGDKANLISVLGRTDLPVGATVPILIGPEFDATVAGSNVKVNSFMGLLNFITTNSKTSILSTPQILALDNEKAEFQVQDTIPVVGSTTAGTATSAPVTNFENRKVGIDIKLTPHINAASGQVRMEIEQQVDNIKDSSGSVPQALEGKSIATTSRKTNTSVVVKDGDYVALGGLMSDKITEVIKKVPLLGDIPVLGWLFKTRTASTVKTNLIILLHPKIIGTALASAENIKRQLNERDEFLKDQFSGTDAHERRVKGIREDLDAQEGRAATEPVFDYRNNNEEDENDTPRVTTPTPHQTRKAKPDEPPLMNRLADPAAKMVEPPNTAAAPNASDPAKLQDLGKQQDPTKLEDPLGLPDAPLLGQ